MNRRRAEAAAGIETKIGNHSFRVTGITAYLKKGGTLEKASAMASHPHDAALRPPIWNSPAAMKCAGGSLEQVAANQYIRHEVVVPQRHEGIDKGRSRVYPDGIKVFVDQN